MPLVPLPIKYITFPTSHPSSERSQQCPLHGARVVAQGLLLVGAEGTKFTFTTQLRVGLLCSPFTVMALLCHARACAGAWNIDQIFLFKAFKLQL